MMTEDPPCVGLDPDTYECPFCGATLDEPCKHGNFARCAMVAPEINLPAM